MFRSGRSGRVDSPDDRLDKDPEQGELLTLHTAPATERAFEELFRSVYVDLHGYVVRRFGFEGADDICAETLTTAFSRWGDAPDSLTDRRRWTFGIAHHKLQEAMRRRTRDLVSVVSIVPHPGQTRALDEDVAALDRTRRLLDRLPSGERDAVYLTVIAGFSSAEAGAILGCSATAITSRVSRARARLMVILEKEREGSDERGTG